MDSPINVLSLCTGYGGVELGLRGLGIPMRAVAYVEREGFAIANLVQQMEAGAVDAAPVFTDVKTFPYERFLGRVDLLTSGYPCQPFSSCGRRAGKDDPRHLWPWIADGIAACRPGWVFLENVEGHISLGLSTVISDLEEMGYRTTWGIFSASEVGAPHQRKRVFILGHAKGDDQRRAPIPSMHGQGEQVGRPSGDVADSGSPRLEGHAWHVNGEGRERDGAGRSIAESGLLPCRWPSRPGEAQQEWEEPRTVGDGARELPHRNVAGTKQTGRREFADSGQGQVEPELGRAVDGAARGVDATVNRVDRLRLLGNGVVPATAAKAFATLHDELMK